MAPRTANPDGSGRSSSARRTARKRAGYSRGGRAVGFTLLESLLVVAIVALIAGTALLRSSATSQDLAARTEAARLHALIGLAAQRAVLRGRRTGVRLSATGYEFLVTDGRGWRPIADDRSYRPRRLPPGVTLRVRDARTRGGGDAARLPQVVLWSSGEITPFSISVSGADRGPVHRIEGAADGTLWLERADRTGAERGPLRP
jgi:general secretion pathway protein H